MSIVIITTGGTATNPPGTDGRVPLPENRGRKWLENMYPDLISEGREVLDWANIDSSEIVPSNWVSLADLVFKAGKTATGIVIVIGTDTLCWMAAYLAFAIQRLNIPVVLTGAHVPCGDFDTDFGLNFRDALLVASSPLAETAVVFDGRIIRGVRAAKTRTGYNSFDSVPHPAIGMIRHGRLTLRHCRTRTACSQPEFINPSPLGRIKPLRVTPTTDIAEFDGQYDGYLILGLGEGNLRRDLRLRVEELAKEVPVVMASGCRYGRQDSKYEAAPGAVIPASTMTWEAAEVKLAWLCGQQLSRTEIERKVLQNMVGEF
jgi:L-asparaginase